MVFVRSYLLLIATVLIILNGKLGSCASTTGTETFANRNLKNIYLAAYSAGPANGGHILIQTYQSQYNYNSVVKSCYSGSNIRRIRFGLIMVDMSTTEADTISCYFTFNRVQAKLFLDDLKNKQGRMVAIVTNKYFLGSYFYREYWPDVKKLLGIKNRHVTWNKLQLTQFIYIGKVGSKTEHVVSMYDVRTRRRRGGSLKMNVAIKTTVVSSANLKCGSIVEGNTRQDISDYTYNVFQLDADSRVTFKDISNSSSSTVCINLLAANEGVKMKKCHSDPNSCDSKAHCSIGAEDYQLRIHGSGYFTRRGYFKIQIACEPFCTGTGYDYREKESRHEKICDPSSKCRIRSEDAQSGPQCLSKANKPKLCYIRCADAMYCTNMDKILAIANIDREFVKTKCKDMQNKQHCPVKCMPGYTSTGSRPRCLASINQSSTNANEFISLWDNLPRCYLNTHYCTQHWKEEKYLVRNESNIPIGNQSTYTCKPGYSIDGNGQSQIGRRQCIANTNQNGAQSSTFKCNETKAYCNATKLALGHDCIEPATGMPSQVKMNGKLYFQPKYGFEFSEYSLRMKNEPVSRVCVSGGYGIGQGNLSWPLPACRRKQDPLGALVNDMSKITSVPVTISTFSNLYLKVATDQYNVIEEAKRQGIYAQKIFKGVGRAYHIKCAHEGIEKFLHSLENGSLVVTNDLSNTSKFFINETHTPGHILIQNAFNASVTSLEKDIQELEASGNSGSSQQNFKFSNDDIEQYFVRNDNGNGEEKPKLSATKSKDSILLSQNSNQESGSVVDLNLLKKKETDRSISMFRVFLVRYYRHFDYVPPKDLSKEKSNNVKVTKVAASSLNNDDESSSSSDSDDTEDEEGESQVKQA